MFWCSGRAAACKYKKNKDSFVIMFDDVLHLCVKLGLYLKIRVFVCNDLIVNIWSEVQFGFDLVVSVI